MSPTPTREPQIILRQLKAGAAATPGGRPVTHESPAEKPDDTPAPPKRGLPRPKVSRFTSRIRRGPKPSDSAPAATAPAPTHLVERADEQGVRAVVAAAAGQAELVVRLDIAGDKLLLADRLAEALAGTGLQRLVIVP